MKALIEITAENALELIAFHIAEPGTKFLDADGTEIKDPRYADKLEVEISIEQLQYKPRKKREGE